MTVAELIEILKKRPKKAKVFLWNPEDVRYENVESVSDPRTYKSRPSDPPLGSVVIWGS